MPSFLERKTVVITNALSAIGRQGATDLVAAGATVILIDDNEQLLRELCMRLGSKSGFALANMLEEESVARTIHDFVRAGFEFNVLLALPATHSPKALLNTWEVLLDLNVKTVANALNAVMPYFKQKNEGHIIIVGSVLCPKRESWQPCYQSSKAALVGLANGVRNEFALTNANVSLVLTGPAPIPSEKVKQIGEVIYEEEKCVSPTDIVHIIVYVAACTAVTAGFDISISFKETIK